MLSETTIRKELRALEKTLRENATPADRETRANVYGAMQALSWALGRDAAKVSSFPKSEATR